LGTVSPKAIAPDNGRVIVEIALSRLKRIFR